MSQIKVGDLVVVVRWPCCGAHLGRVFRVAVSRVTKTTGTGCWQCRRGDVDFTLSGEPCVEEGGTGFMAVERYVKRIPPLEELDDVKRDKEIAA